LVSPLMSFVDGLLVSPPAQSAGLFTNRCTNPTGISQRQTRLNLMGKVGLRTFTDPLGHRITEHISLRCSRSSSMSSYCQHNASSSYFTDKLTLINNSDWPDCATFALLFTRCVWQCLTEHIEGKVACFDQFTSIIIVFSFDGGVFCHFISANMKMIIFTLDRFACKRSVYYDLRQMLFPQLRCTRKESCAQYKHLYNLVKMKKALQRLNLKKFFTTLNGNVEFNLVDQQLVIL
ncbi:hypothetical protein T4A_1514, partial [Trichinella pseudospiralis]